MTNGMGLDMIFDTNKFWWSNSAKNWQTFFVQLFTQKKASQRCWGLSKTSKRPVCRSVLTGTQGSNHDMSVSHCGARIQFPALASIFNFLPVQTLGSFCHLPGKPGLSSGCLALFSAKPLWLWTFQWLWHWNPNSCRSKSVREIPPLIHFFPRNN